MHTITLYDRDAGMMVVVTCRVFSVEPGIVCADGVNYFPLGPITVDYKPIIPND